MPWELVFKQILGEGGPWPALFLMACGVIAYMFVSGRSREGEHRQEGNNWDSEKAELFEKRLDETKAVLTALERNTSALASMTASVESRTQAINELVQGFAAMVRTNEVTREHFKVVAERLEKIAADNRQMLRDLTFSRTGRGPME